MQTLFALRSPESTVSISDSNNGSRKLCKVFSILSLVNPVDLPITVPLVGIDKYSDCNLGIQEEPRGINYLPLLV
jgi:hypothetical protein